MAYLEQMKQTQIPYKIGDNIQFFDSKCSIRTGIIKCFPLPNTTKYGVLSEKLIVFIDYFQIIGKTQIQNHLLPNTLDLLNPLTLTNTMNSYPAQPLSFEDLFENLGVVNIPVSETKQWFDKHLTLDTDNGGCGHCFYHCITKGLTDGPQENLGQIFRRQFYEWLMTENTNNEIEQVRLQTYNDLRQKDKDGLLYISYDGINYTPTTFDDYLLGIAGNTWADNVIISVVQTWITLMGHNKYFIIYDSNRDRFTLGGSTETLPRQILEQQIRDNSFFFINYNGVHYQNLKKIV
jgi:hypothetical protein